MIITDITNENVNSYATVSDLDDFAKMRNVDLPSDTESLLIKAMDYLEGLNWKGDKVKIDQPLSFPRTKLKIGTVVYPDNKIPNQIIKAQCMLAIEAINGDLLQSIKEPTIKSESIAGVVTLAYAVDDNGFKPSYPLVDNLLSDFVMGKGFAINAISERG